MKIEPLRAPHSFTTARLHLRRPRHEDGQLLFQTYTQDPDVTRYLSWAPHTSEEDAVQFLLKADKLWRDTGFGPYLIELLENKDRPIGSIGLARPPAQPHRVSLGYALARLYWGQGFMTEAASCLSDWAMAQTTIWRVSAFCDVENTASARVLEKAGFAFEGIMRRFIVAPNLSPEPRDVCMFARVRNSTD